MDISDEEKEKIIKENIKKLEQRIKERKISKAYIEQTMDMFGLDYAGAMMAALDGC